MAALARYFPILGWARAYDRNALTSDLVAASIVTIMLVPQSLAYAMLAGLPPQVGLYASILPLLAYAVFGTSRTLAVGPVAVISLMTATAAGGVAAQGSAEYVAAALVLLVGSGLLLQSFRALRAVDPGYETEDIFTFQMAPDPEEHGLDNAAERYKRFHPPRPPLYGLWSVEGFAVDGKDVPLFTDPDRWRLVMFAQAGTVRVEEIEVPILGSVAAGVPILAEENVTDRVVVDRGALGERDAGPTAQERGEPLDEVPHDVTRGPSLDRGGRGPVASAGDQPRELPGHHAVAGGRGVREGHQSVPSASIRSIAA